MHSALPVFLFFSGHNIIKGSDHTEYIIAAAFAALAGLGVGGGGLLVIYLTGALGVEQRLAQGVNLCFFIIASFASLFYYVGKRRINYPLVFFAAAVGALFSVLGTAAAGLIPSDILRRLFGVFMAIAGIITLTKTFRAKRKK